MRKTLLKCVLSFLLASLTVLWGQATTGTLSGKITNAAGAGVANAAVTVTNVSTNVSQRVLTGPDGGFQVSNLPSGTYRVDVETQGFKHATQQNIVLSPTGPATVNVVLQPGNINETVSIKGTAPVVQDQSGEVNLGLGYRPVNELPIVDRNHQQLNQLQTGITLPTAVLPLALDPPRNRFWSADGQAPGTNVHVLDGGLNLEPYRGGAIRVQPEETIQQMNIVTASSSATRGWYAGSDTALVTRGGTNPWHGDLFENWTGNSLGSRPFFDIAPAGPRYTRNQFGGDAGGAIVPDHIFVFGSYEGDYFHGRMSELDTVPTAGMLTGNFSGIPGISLLNPATGRPFANNMIPGNLINPQAAGLASLLPAPNFASGFGGFANNFLGFPRFKNDGNRGDIRVDDRFSDRTTAFLRYGYSNWMTEQSSALGLLGSNVYNRQLAHNAVADVSHSFSSRLLTDLRLDYNRYNQNFNPLGTSIFGTSGFGANLLPNNFNIAGLPSFGTPAAMLGRDLDNTYHATWNWAYRTDHHNFKLGAEGYEARSSGFNSPLLNPFNSAAFGPGTTLAPGSTLTPFSQFANSFAGFLLGTPSQVSSANYLTTPTINQSWWAGYALDSIHVRHNLTVELGLRYTAFSPFWAQKAGGAMFYNPAGNSVNYAGIGGVPLNGGMNWDTDNFAPHIGVAFSPTNKTVIRGGYSINYFQNPFMLAPFMPGMYGFSSGVPGTFGIAGTGIGATPALAPAALVNGTPAPNIPLMYTTQNTLQTPYVHNLSLQVQQDLGANFVLSAGYVGAFARELPYFAEANAALPGTGIAGLPFARFGRTASTLQYSQGLTSNYNSLQVMLMKRLSYGLSFQGAYTYSRALGYTTGNDMLLNPFNRSANYGLMDFDHMHTLTLSHLWEVPIGNGTHYLNTGFLGKLLASWEVNGVFTWETGSPLTLTADPLSCACPGLAAVGANASGPVVTSAMYGPNTSFFGGANITAPVNSFGNLGRGSVYGPGFKNYDLSVFKTIPYQHFKFELRGEAYNLTNTPHLINPVVNVNAANFGNIGGQFSPVANIASFGRMIDFELRLMF